MPPHGMLSYRNSPGAEDFWTAAGLKPYMESEHRLRQLPKVLGV
jgi:hypothetical protein